MKPELKRDKKVTCRWSEAEFKKLSDRAERAGTTPSGYLRAVALTTDECNEFRWWTELKALRNELIVFGDRSRTDPIAMEAVIRALDRISRF